MILRLIEEVIAAAVGTMAFALMFHVPRQYYFVSHILFSPLVLFYEWKVSNTQLKSS